MQTSHKHLDDVANRQSFGKGRTTTLLLIIVGTASLFLSSNRHSYLPAVLDKVKSAHAETWSESGAQLRNESDPTMHPRLRNNTRTGSVIAPTVWTPIDTDNSTDFESGHSPDFSTLNDHASTNSTQEDKAEKKPWLILHIGPPKTGTTSIQCGLEKYSQHLMDLDNYYYMGIKCGQGRRKSRDNKMANNETSIRGTALAYVMNGVMEPTSETNRIFERLDNHRNKGHNVIISSEHLMSVTAVQKTDINAFWSNFKSLISGFQVKAVLVHRFVLDFVPSQYFQSFYTSSNTPIPSFLTYLENSLTFWATNQGRKAAKYIIDFVPVMELWSQHFDLKIMDFYSENFGGDVFQHFVCSYVPNATNACQLVTQEKAKPNESGGAIRARVGGTVQPLRAFFHAMQLYNISNLDDKTEHMKTKAKFLGNANQVFERFDILSNPYYLDCMSSDQEARLKNYSLYVMQSYYQRELGSDMSELELADGIAKQNRLFEKIKAEGKYCDVNLEKLFFNDTIAAELMKFR